VLSQNLSVGSEENHEDLPSLYSVSGLDSNPVPKVLTATLRYSVLVIICRWITKVVSAA
jgi:hypothetical protein